MRSHSLGNRLDPNDAAIARYESLWRTETPSLERFLAQLGPSVSTTLLGSLIKVDLQNRFDLGDRPTAAEYLERFPELVESGERVVSLIYEEFCLLQENGEDPDSALFCERYEPWSDSLRSQLVYHRELSRVVGAESPPTRYPRPGDQFANYRLRSILGTGGAARVYLATDDGLGGRKVALKVSASIGREPSILANLDHQNIVPVLTVAESEEGLRGFCMPYRPGLTLEKLIQKIGTNSLPRTALAVWEALRLENPEEVEGLEQDRPGWGDFPLKGTYSEAVVWVGLVLANALAYLHVRGVLHRDIKPANVLLAYREGPQLLDFNLAHAPSDPEQAQAALKGGTLPYMAPEQLRAFLDSAEWSRVGAPADLYALGLVLRGLLTGQPPEVPNSRLPLTRAIQALHDRRSEPVVPVRRLNPGVPPALESILGKCLEFEPSQRYEGAAELAEDLRRFLNRRPMKFADNTSMVERASNCLFRNRVAALLLIIGLFGSMSVRSVLQLIPAQPVAQFVLALADRPDWDRAVADLDSKNPADWMRARHEFRRLGAKVPHLARPKLYESAALEKLGLHLLSSRHLADANDRLKEASKLSDFLEALNHRLKEAPRSATLLIKRATMILEDKTSTESARHEAQCLLHRALASEPDRVEALGILADLERKAGRHDQAILYFAKSLTVAESKPKNYSRVLIDARLALLPLMTKQADALLEQGATLEARTKSRPIYRRAEATLEALEQTWAEGPIRENADQVDFLGAFYRGWIASGLASVAAHEGNIPLAKNGFDQARRYFEDALKLAENNAEHRDQMSKSVEDRVQQLTERSAQIVSESKSQPASALGNVFHANSR